LKNLGQRGCSWESINEKIRVGIISRGNRLTAVCAYGALPETQNWGANTTYSATNSKTPLENRFTGILGGFLSGAFFLAKPHFFGLHADSVVVSH
jgi:hypothetical protein